MRFAELRPSFKNPKEPVTVQNAWAVDYDCPQCKRDGLQHRIYTPLWGKDRWQVTGGTTMHDLTFVPSVRVVSGTCHGHWNITNGEVIFHPDSCRTFHTRIRLPSGLHLERHHHASAQDAVNRSQR